MSTAAPLADGVAVAGRPRLVTSEFLIVTAATGLFFLCVGIQIPLLPRLIEEQLGGSEFDIGLNLAVFSVSAILIRPVLGPWGDRYGRRVLMIGGSLLASIGLLLSSFVEHRWELLPLRAIGGIGEGALFVGAATLVSDLAPSHRRAEAASYFSVAVFGGIGIGPVIGEALTTGDRFGRGLVAASVFAFAAAVCSLFVPRNGAGAATQQPIEQPIEHIRPVHRFHRDAIRPGVVLALGIAGFATFTAFVPEHARNVGLSGSKWVFAIYSVVCLVVRLFGARLPERLGLARAISIALGFLAIGLVALFALATPAGLFIGASLIGVGMSFIYPALMAVTANGVPEHERARVISTFTMFFEVGSAGGALTFGLLAEVTSKRGAFLGGAMSALLGLWYLWRVLIPWTRSRPIPASEAPMDATH